MGSREGMSLDRHLHRDGVLDHQLRRARSYETEQTHMANLVIRKLASSKNHLPHPGTIIAASFTSPLDPLYLAAIFRPVFTRSFPATRQVEQISLFRAILMAFAPPTTAPPDQAKLITLASLEQKYPDSIIAVFPECTTTNGRGILPFSPSLLSARPATRIYPVNLRYTPGDITTPVPGGYFSWLWKLCSKPTHSMRVRIAECVYNTPTQTAGVAMHKEDSVFVEATGFDTNIFDSPHLRTPSESSEEEDAVAQMGKVKKTERKVLDRVGEDLARLGRVKRVGLGVKEKVQFVKVWTKRRR